MTTLSLDYNVEINQLGLFSNSVPHAQNIYIYATKREQWEICSFYDFNVAMPAQEPHVA
jgi:hypothetical protein